MNRQGEINYFKNLSPKDLEAAINKPFSDKNHGLLLAELGTMMSLLPLPPARILDLGCGTGWTSVFLAKTGYEIIGQDISPEAITQANIIKEKEKLNNLNFVLGDFEEMDYHSEFDGVVFFSSLHHSVNEKNAIVAAYKALKPGGVCITSEPGIRHSQSSEAIEAVKKYNVIEKNMPPKFIIRNGKKAGFKSFKTYYHPCNINLILYRSPKHFPVNNFLKKLFKFNFVRILAALFVMIFYKRYSGIVVMVK